MFHVEHIIIQATAAVVFSAAAVAALENNAANQGTTPLPCPAVSLPLSAKNPEVKQLIEAGFTDLILGWEESACVHFAKAIELGEATDNRHLMAYCGMMLAAPERGTKDANRMILMEHLGKVPCTPVELFYLNTFLKLMGGDVEGAAQDFDSRASKYRRDTFSALWAIMLHHCCEVGYDVLNRANKHQARALEMAEKLVQEQPQNALAHYVRAYIEEAAPELSEGALKAAQKAAGDIPQHPMPQLVYGHLLYRKGLVKEAVPYLQLAVKNASKSEIKEEQNRQKMIARLYESTALWSARREEEALATRRAMNAVPVNQSALSAGAVVLHRWEANTLPLRVLILRATPPTLGEIKAAFDAATPNPPLPNDEAVLLVRDCLQAALYARARVAQNNIKYAQKSLELANQAFEKFEDTRDKVFSQGPEFVTPWHRAREACRMATLAAGAAIYPDDDNFWKKVAEAEALPTTMLLPPPVPMQYGPEPEKVSPPKSTPKKAAKKSKNRRM